MHTEYRHLNRLIVPIANDLLGPIVPISYRCFMHTAPGCQHLSCESATEKTPTQFSHAGEVGRGRATGVRRVRTALCSTLVRVQRAGDRGEEGAYRVVQHVGEGPVGGGRGRATGVRRVRTA